MGEKEVGQGEGQLEWQCSLHAGFTSITQGAVELITLQRPNGGKGAAGFLLTGHWMQLP